MDQNLATNPLQVHDNSCVAPVCSIHHSAFSTMRVPTMMNVDIIAAIFYRTGSDGAEILDQGPETAALAALLPATVILLHTDLARRAFNVPAFVRNIGLRFTDQLEVDNKAVRAEWDSELEKAAREQ